MPPCAPGHGLFFRPLFFFFGQAWMSFLGIIVVTPSWLELSSGLSPSVGLTHIFLQYFVDCPWDLNRRTDRLTEDEHKSNLAISLQEMPSPLSDEQLFEPDYYWSYTILKSYKFNTLYLGSDTNGKATLLPIGSTTYPNPQNLFIFNEVNI